MSDASKRDRFIFQQLDQIICRRFAFDIGRQRKNDLGKLLGLDAIEEFLNAQIFRANMIERRNASA